MNEKDDHFNCRCINSDNSERSKSSLLNMFSDAVLHKKSIATIIGDS
jgi:hypothetical protein